MTSDRPFGAASDAPTLKSRIGEQAGPLVEPVSAERVEEFSRAVAARPGHGVPPTFLTVFRRLEFDLFDQLGIPLAKVLHAEQEYTYERPLKIGMKVRYQTQLANVLEKRGKASSIAFLVFETAFEDAEGGGGRLASSKTTIVVKDPYS